MATATQKSERTYTGEALELLECFSHGFDDLLCRMAEQQADIGEHSGRIGAEEIKKAGDLILEAVSSSEVSDDVKALVRGMIQCMAQKARK
jgi:hypothetical protein